MPQHRKRVKRDIFASPLDFQRLHPDFAAAEEQKHEQPAMQAQADQVDMLHSNLGHVPVGGGPNIIGNVEDGPVLPDRQPSEPGTPQAQSRHHSNQGGDQVMYREIIPQRTEAQAARMASRRTKSKERAPS